jgi:hypothetical protein
MTGDLPLGFRGAQPSAPSLEKRAIILACESVSRPGGVRGGYVLPGFKWVQDRSNTASLLA